jgi:small-conductance mechanosensitive channel
MSGYSKGRLLAALSRGYEQQLAWYKEMHRIALEHHRLCREADFAEDSEMDKLRKLISARQELMGQLDKQNQVLAKVKKELADLLKIPEIRLSTLRAALHPSVLEQEAAAPSTAGAAETGNGAEAADALGQTLDALATLLKEINELDGETQELMHQKLAAAKTEIDKIQAGKKAQEVYRSVSRQQPDPMFLDKKK